MEQLVGLGVVAIVVAAVIWIIRSQDEKGAQNAAATKARAPERHITALGAAIEDGRLDDVQRLLASGSDPNEATDGDLPALHCAALHGRTDAIAPLIAAGAAVDHADPDIGGSVGLAIARSHEETALALLSQGAAIDVVNEGGATALHYAAMVGTEELVAALLDRGAPPDTYNFQGGTPLRSAAERGRLENVELLIARGAHRATRDAFGKLPIDYARASDFDQIVALLEGATPKDASPPGRAPLRMLLPPRNDASLRTLEHVLRQNARPTRVAATSIEAPTLIHSVRRARGLEDFIVEAPTEDDPDPREPVRTVRTLLWRYDGIQPSPVPRPPNDETASVVAKIAALPYRLASWSERAATRPSLDPSMLAAAMAIPPLGPAYLPPWHWAFRCQVAAALLLAHQGEPWASSAGRGVLLDVLDGPADWSNTAAIVALYDVGRRDAEARADVERALWETVRRTPTAPAFQHAMEPAAQALRELGASDPDGELAELLDRRR